MRKVVTTRMKSHPFLNAQAGMQLNLYDRANGPADGKRRPLTAAVAGAGLALAVAPAIAGAQAPRAPGGTIGECASGGSNSTSSLTSFIQQAANFLIIIGGALAVLMFAIGGFMIMGLGGTKKVRQGMNVVKNALIGLAIMVSGIFVREILVTFIGGATGGNDSTNCARGGFGGGTTPRRPAG